MPVEGRQRTQILDRCWSIYLWLTQAFNLPETFSVEFPAAAESALITSSLHVTVPISEKLTLSPIVEGKPQVSRILLTRQKAECPHFPYKKILTSAGKVKRIGPVF